MLDEGVDFLDQIVDAGERTTANRALGDDAKPTFHLYLCEQAAVEQDSDRLLELIKEINRFECSVLRGASQVMRRHPKVAIEVHPCWLPRYGSSASEVVALLYRVLILPHGLQQVKPWSGEELGGYSQKFNLFLLPAQL